MAPKPRTPASMRVRSAVRPVLREFAGIRGEDHPHLVLVALSGGADSLALAAALAAEATGAAVRAGAVVIDHGLQPGSAEVAARAAEQARGLGLDPVIVRRVTVGAKKISPENTESGGQRAPKGGILWGVGQADSRGAWPVDETGGPEAAARSARYEALASVAREAGAGLVLTAHTRDDQAEQVLLALARGSGTRSIAGIPPRREIAPGVHVARPLLAERFEVTRAVTEASCAELALEPWQDPHNADPTYARVRVRTTALPTLERELGRGFGAALARSADLAREDADALDALAETHLEAIVSYRERGEDADAPTTSEVSSGEDRQVVLPVDALRALPAALRGRVIRLASERTFDAQLTREHTLAIASLVTAWRGQGPIHAPRIVVVREAGNLVIRRH